MLTDDTEIVTVVAAASLCDRIARQVRTDHPHVDVATICAAIDDVWLGVE